MSFPVLFSYKLLTSSGKVLKTGWPRHRENREFGSYFFQTGKTQGILFWHREKFGNTENIWAVIINIKSMFIFLNFKIF